MSYESREGKKSTQRQTCDLFFVFFQKGTSLYEGPFAVECRLRDSNCIVGAVFGGTIKDCATVGGTIVGGAIIASTILDGTIFGSIILGGAMVGCAMVDGAIIDGAIKGGTIRGSTSLHHFRAPHRRQQN